MDLPLLTQRESVQTCGVLGSCMRSSLSTCSKAASGADSLMLHSGTSDSKPMLVSTCMPLTNNNNNNNDDSDINNKVVVIIIIIIMMMMMMMMITRICFAAHDELGTCGTRLVSPHTAWAQQVA